MMLRVATDAAIVAGSLLSAPAETPPTRYRSGKFEEAASAGRVGGASTGATYIYRRLRPAPTVGQLNVVSGKADIDQQIG